MPAAAVRAVLACGHLACMGVGASRRIRHPALKLAALAGCQHGCTPISGPAGLFARVVPVGPTMLVNGLARPTRLGAVAALSAQ